MSERKDHIKVLKQFLKDYQEWGESLELEESVKFAINSLEVDEAYQLEYERAMTPQDGRQFMLGHLAKEPIEVLQTAFLYAKNYTQYGANVVEQWQTAIRQSADLQKAYQKGYYEAMERISSTPKEPTTKNDLAQERYQDLIEYFGDEKVAKTILQSRKEFKAWLERLRWNVKRADELARELEQIKGITKNDLGVDLISRSDAIKAMQDKVKKLTNEDTINGLCGAVAILFDLPPVTPQEPKVGHWKLVQRGKVIDVCCSNCEAVRIKGYAYNYTIDELSKEDINECFGSAEMRYCPNCGAKMESEEE